MSDPHAGPVTSRHAWILIEVLHAISAGVWLGVWHYTGHHLAQWFFYYSLVGFAAVAIRLLFTYK